MHIGLKSLGASLLLITGLWTVVRAQPGSTGGTRLLRFPTLSQTAIAFSYGGDLYTVPRSGGVARRLTADTEGYECFPKFSPDGRTIAFTGQYDGNTEVFTIPATGGEPRRLTWTGTLTRDDISDRQGPNNIVMTWHPGGQRIVFRNRSRSFNSFKGVLCDVAIGGGPIRQLPFSVGGFCSYSPDGRRIAYNRVFREFRTWKYYRGGMADDIWVHEFATGKVVNLTNHPAQDIQPMWHADRVYFLSDRDRTMNLFVHDLTTGKTRKVTAFTDYDVKFPSLGPDGIVFEQGGDLWVLSLQTEKASRVPVTVQDDPITARSVYQTVADQFEGFAALPEGKGVVLNARGSLFVWPHTGAHRQLTYSDAHVRQPLVSPDGKTVYYVSDETGEDQWYRQRLDRAESPVALTTGNDCYIWGGVLSPNGKVLVWQDARKRLRSLRLDDPARTIRQLDASDYGEFSGLAFSPDSRWLAYVRPGWQTANRIWLYSFQAGTRTPATDAWHDAASPAFSPDGNYLYFVSARDFSPVYSRTEWNTAYANMDRLCLLLLRRTALNPLRPDYGDLRPDTTRLNTARQVQVDFEGLSDRVVVLPPPGAQYTGLLAVGKRLFYLMSKQGDTQSQLRYFDLAEQKEGTAAAQADGLALTPNATHVAYLHRKDKKIVLLTPNSGKTEPAEHKRLDYATVGKVVNLRAEWNQIYHEAWRQMRDFFYAPNLHGVNWPAMRDKYRVLLPHARHRSDVSYLIGELIGELNAGHAYVNNGQAPRPDRLKLGQLGIDTERDATTGAVQITRILHGFQDLRSPLAEPGLGVKTGHWIIAVNGRRLTPEVPDLNAALVNTAGQPTELTLATTAQGANPRTLTVVPLEDEADLRYVEWVQRNLRYVHEQTNGRVGYLHIPDMSAAGLNEFVKYFYPQLDKEALIIDDRGNGGGNVSPMIIERLRRELDMVLMSRGNRPTPSPTDQLVGPKVLLIDQYSASDGDLFAYRFKHYKLGKVVGVRSWGGTVGIRSSLPFVDGSTLHKPEFSRYDVAGKDWIIEGYGVDPDITVVNDPAREYLGYDDQLDEAIRQATRALENRKGLAPMPPYPDKTR